MPPDGSERNEIAPAAQSLEKLNDEDAKRAAEIIQVPSRPA
jgi:hypothetical protein